MKANCSIGSLMILNDQTIDQLAPKIQTGAPNLEAWLRGNSRLLRAASLLALSEAVGLRKGALRTDTVLRWRVVTEPSGKYPDLWVRALRNISERLDQADVLEVRPNLPGKKDPLARAYFIAREGVRIILLSENGPQMPDALDMSLLPQANIKKLGTDNFVRVSPDMWQRIMRNEMNTAEFDDVLSMNFLVTTWNHVRLTALEYRFTPTELVNLIEDAGVQRDEPAAAPNANEQIIDFVGERERRAIPAPDQNELMATATFHGAHHPQPSVAAQETPVDSKQAATV